jgi:tape measure domain-containing protein
MAANMDALLRIKAEVAGAAAANAALQGMQRLTQQLADTQAKSAAANNQAVQQSITLNQKLAQATTAAGIEINNAEKQVLASKLQQAKTDKDRQAIQNQLADLEIKNGRLRRQGIESQLNSEVQLAVKKRDAIALEQKRAQAAVATAGKYGQITPEILRQAEAARRNLALAEKDVRVTTQIAAEKRKVADAQLKATEAQAQMSRAVDTTRSKMSALGQVISGLGIADLARRMGDFAKSTLEAGEQSGLVSMRIKNLAGEFNETAAVTKLAADSAKRYGLSQLEAAGGVADLYGRLRPLGIGLADIQSTFIGVNNAAKQAGLSTYDAKEAFLQLGQAMGSGKLQGDELRSLMERMPAIGRAIVDVFNDIARSKGLEQISKEKADVLIKQVKEGEKRQTEIMKEQASLRIEALRNETDKHLGEIDKRYRRQQQIMEDRFEDQDDATRRSNDRQLDATIDGINERAEAERKAIERRFEDRRKIVEDDKTINDALKTQLLRNLEDEKSAVLKAIGDREEAATTQVRDAADDRNKQLSRINRDARQQEQEALEASKQKELDIVKASFEQQKTTLESKLKADIETNKQATAATLANLVASTKVTVGELKQLGADGLLTTDIIVMAMKKLEQIKPPPPTAMQQFTAAMADLRMELGENLLPLLTPGIELLTGLLRAFNGLPEPIKAVAGGVLLLAGALAAIALPLAGFVGVINLLAGAVGFAVITGGLSAIAGFLLSWPVLLVAAGAGIFLFRDQIYGVVDGINKSIQSTFKTIIDLLALNLEIIGKAVYGAVDGINKGIRTGLSAVWDWVSSSVGRVASALVRPFEIAAGGIKNVLRSVLSFAASVINSFIGAINQMIRNVNNVAARLRLPTLPTFGAVQVPSFEGGGYTGNAPRSGGLDGRGGFMALVHPRETIIDHTRAAAGGSGGGVPNITIRTGEVLQMPDGSQWVSMGDFQAGMQTLANGIMSQLRSPSGRMALRGA